MKLFPSEPAPGTCSWTEEAVAANTASFCIMNSILHYALKQVRSQIDYGNGFETDVQERSDELL